MATKEHSQVAATEVALEPVTKMGGASLPVRSDVSLRVSTIQVMLGDDQLAVRGLLRHFLEAGDYQVVGECTGGAEMIALCAACRVDVLILDLGMQDLAFCQLVEDLKVHSPLTRILVFSRWMHPFLVRNCIVAGVHGIVFKNDSLGTLYQAVQIVSQGGMYFSPTVEQYRNAGVHQLLTDREQLALCLIAQGYSTKEMAVSMEISNKTAEKYRERIMNKLGLHDAVKLTHYAIQAGLVAP